MADRPDYYVILGISRECGSDELKTAYRKQALKYHPDRNPGDKEAEDQFKACAEAYEILSDPNRRQIYDQFGHDGLAGNGVRGFNNFNDIFTQFGDIFHDFFGFSPSRHSSAVAGADLRYDLSISFEQAVFGDEIDLQIPRRATCHPCQGSGARPGTSPQPCRTCQGRGQVYRSQGLFRLATTCPACQGKGRVITDPCPACKGKGRFEETATVRVRIPAGMDSDLRLRLREEGDAGLDGGPSGDLFVVIQVEEHEFFERQGDHLIYHLQINMAQAALGGEVEVPTLDEDKPNTVKIPAGIQSGHVFRFRGEGVPHLRGLGRGDLLAAVEVETPTGLTERQKELLAEFGRIEAEKTEKKPGFLDRLRSRPKKRAKSERAWN